MKLRFRLIGAFTLVALPGVVIATTAVGLIDKLIRDEIFLRTDEVIDETTKLIEEEKSEIIRVLENTAASDPLLLSFAAQKNKIDEQNEALETWAPKRAASLRLDLLAVAAQKLEGPELLTSAHLPVAVGDAPPDLSSNLKPGETRAGITLEMVEGNPPEFVPALVAVHMPVQGGGRLWIYGGRRLDHRLLGRIARAANARLALHLPHQEALIFPEATRAFDQPHLIPLPVIGDLQTARLEVSVNTDHLWAARRRFLRLSEILILAALSAALLAGAWLSTRITQPIVSLSSAAERVGRGDMTVRVYSAAQDEVGSLVREFNRMIEELAEAQLRIQRAERVAAWREVARRLAHEIKNPLSPMRLGMENLRKAWNKKHPKIDEIIKESTSSVLDEVATLDRLVTAFSAFAQLPAPVLRRVDPLELLTTAARLYDARVQCAHGLETQTLPTVFADPDQIGRALVNLIKNAQEAMPDEEESLVVLNGWSQNRDGRGGVILEVADNGPGMSDEVRARATSVYYSTKVTGTGLGLAIVQRTIEEHGGCLHILSHPGAGTRVQLWLPSSD